jgi:transcriptional regulator with XRE-family HTH domain
MLLEPLRIPIDVWSHSEVRAALPKRDIGALFRLILQLTGTSQSRIGASVGLEQGYVSRIIAGRKVTSIDVLERIADGCDMPDDARTTLGLATRQLPYRSDPAANRQINPGIPIWRDVVNSAVRTVAR